MDCCFILPCACIRYCGVACPDKHDADVLLLGDSSFDFYENNSGCPCDKRKAYMDLQKEMKDGNVVMYNAGCAGLSSYNLLCFAPLPLMCLKPKHIFLSSGFNDLQWLPVPFLNSCCVNYRICNCPLYNTEILVNYCVPCFVGDDVPVYFMADKAAVNNCPCANYDDWAETVKERAGTVLTIKLPLTDEIPDFLRSDNKSESWKDANWVYEEKQNENGVEKLIYVDTLSLFNEVRKAYPDRYHDLFEYGAEYSEETWQWHNMWVKHILSKRFPEKECLKAKNIYSENGSKSR